MLIVTNTPWDKTYSIPEEKKNILNQAISIWYSHGWFDRLFHRSSIIKVLDKMLIEDIWSTKTTLDIDEDRLSKLAEERRNIAISAPEHLKGNPDAKPWIFGYDRTLIYEEGFKDGYKERAKE